jgi:hypothetical protein
MDEGKGVLDVLEAILNGDPGHFFSFVNSKGL